MGKVGAMKRSELRPRKRAVASSSRPIPRPEVSVGGPLRQLKELLHSLYLEAGTPVLDDIVMWIEAQYAADLRRACRLAILLGAALGRRNCR